MTSSKTFSSSALSSELSSKLSLGHSLLTALSSPKLHSVSGVNKLEKKIRQEIKFLSKFADADDPYASGQLKPEHLQCSNLLSLSAVVGALGAAEGPTEVLRPFPLLEQDAFGRNQTKKITADIVCEDGNAWIKVIARNPKALDLNSAGGNQFGQKSFMNQVGDYLTCAEQNPKRFKVPVVIFDFRSGVSERLKHRLERRGIVVRGEVVQVPGEERANFSSSSEDSDSSESSSDEALHYDVDLTKLDLDSSTLNLDITAMIAYVSALTNGHSNYAFKEPILSDQARWERARPVKPVLDDIFEGKQLICCHSAMDDFKSILSTLGGPGERSRSDRLLERVRVVSDGVSPRLADLFSCRKIKARSLAIFGTGDELKVMTVSANSGFVRAARGQGVDLGVILHESRALTEDKMKTGKELSDKELSANEA